jgi:hypothetical protein
LSFAFGQHLDRLRKHFGFNEEFVRVNEGGCDKNPFPKDHQYASGSVLNHLVPALSGEDAMKLKDAIADFFN